MNKYLSNSNEKLKKNKDFQYYKNEFKSNSIILNFTNYINKFIKDCEMNRKKIAEEIEWTEHDITKKTESIKKTINNIKYTTNRDRIILICMVLNMDNDETNIALRLHNMPQLYFDDSRDLIIIYCLNEHKSIKECNKLLDSQKHKILSYEKNYYSDVHSINRKQNFEIVSGPVVHIYDFTNDKSILTAYSPNRYDAVCETIIKFESNEYLLENHEFDRENALGFFHIKNLTLGKEEFHKNLNEIDPVFQEIFIRNNSYIKIEFNNFITTLNDTKNFHYRISPSIKNNRINFYAETFNYEHPEFNEYVQLSLNNDAIKMTVTNKSNFMKKHLDDYNMFYNDNDLTIMEEYNSVDDINNVTNKYVKNMRLQQYNFLKNKIIELLNDIKNRNKFIIYPQEFLNDDRDLANFFNIEDKFEYVFDNSTGYATAKNRYFIEDNITISIDDLMRSYELGLTDLNIVKSLLINGEIDNILNLNSLT